MKSLKAIAVSLVIFCSLITAASAQQILVSAAASLTDVLNGLAPQAEQVIGARLQFNFGASGALRRQIEEGAPVDVFFSASSEDMDRLARVGLVVDSTRSDILSNRVVLIGSAGTPAVQSEDDVKAALSRAGLLAIGNPDTVPAGRYAVQALEAHGWYQMVKSKLVLGGNVREVLQYVQSGSAPLGIVFLTDMLSAGGSVQQLFVFPERSTKPILYPVAVVSASKNREKAAALITFFQGDAARAAFRQAGFILK